MPTNQNSPGLRPMGVSEREYSILHSFKDLKLFLLPCWGDPGRQTRRPEGRSGHFFTHFSMFVFSLFFEPLFFPRKVVPMTIWAQSWAQFWAHFRTFSLTFELFFQDSFLDLFWDRFSWISATFLIVSGTAFL